MPFPFAFFLYHMKDGGQGFYDCLSEMAKGPMGIMKDSADSRHVLRRPHCPGRNCEKTRLAIIKYA